MQQQTSNINVYGVAYIYRTAHKMSFEEHADLLGWSVEEVEFAYWHYLDRIQSWLSVYSRFPDLNDIEEGRFTIEPFTAEHYARYIQEV